MSTKPEQLYIYAWGNPKDGIGRYRQEHLKGRVCRVLHRSKMNNCLLQFIDTGEQLNCSRNALRKVK